MNAIHARRDQGPPVPVLQPPGEPARLHLHPGGLEKLEFFVCLDFFLSETAQHADLVFHSALHEEDEGTTTSTEGRVIRINKAVEPPGEAQPDWRIFVDLARRWVAASTSTTSPRPGRSSRSCGRPPGAGTADYAGITYERIEKENGVFWPCPSEDHPGTPAAVRGRPVLPPRRPGPLHPHPLAPRPWRAFDAEYPVWLTTGRVVYHYLSGSQTRRIGFLVEQCPHPYVEIHPRLAARHGLQEGDPVEVATRRGELVLPAKLVSTIRPDTVFIPYHWPGALSANRLNRPAPGPGQQDPGVQGQRLPDPEDHPGPLPRPSSWTCSAWPGKPPVSRPTCPSRCSDGAGRPRPPPGTARGDSRELFDTSPRRAPWGSSSTPSAASAAAAAWPPAPSAAHPPGAGA